MKENKEVEEKDGRITERIKLTQKEERSKSKEKKCAESNYSKEGKLEGKG